MRPFVSLCAAAIVTTILGHGPSQAQDWLREAIAPQERVHDFGTVARAANTEHRFLIKNNHTSDLHIHSVRTSCGCTTPIIEDEWIKPGETGAVLARFNTGTFTGRKAAAVTVTFDKPVYTELQLNVKGYIRSDVVLSPGEVNFGEVPVGEPKSIDLTLDYAGRNDWALVGAESPLDFADIQFDEVSRQGGRVSYRISAQLTADAPLGNLQNQFLLKTNDRNLTTVPLRFMAAVQPPIQVSPQAIELGTVNFEKPLAQRLVVKARKDFRVLEITSDQAEIQFEASPSAKAVHLLNLMISPKRQPVDGAVASELVIQTDLIDEPIRIPLQFSQLTTDATTSVVKAN